MWVPVPVSWGEGGHRARPGPTLRSPTSHPNHPNHPTPQNTTRPTNHPPTPKRNRQAVPVEEFGAALLRGMGWQGPSEEDVKVYQVQPRPQGCVV